MGVKNHENPVLENGLTFEVSSELYFGSSKAIRTLYPRSLEKCIESTIYTHAYNDRRSDLIAIANRKICNDTRTMIVITMILMILSCSSR